MKAEDEAYTLLFHPEKFSCKCHVNNQILKDGSFGLPQYYLPYNGETRWEMGGIVF